MTSSQTTTNSRQPDWPLIIFFAIAFLIPWSMVPILSSIASQTGVADWTTLAQMGELFNGNGGSLLPVMIFHAAQNSEEIFETLFPGLVGTDWELISSLGLLLFGLIAGVLLWRGQKAQSPAKGIA